MANVNEIGKGQWLGGPGLGGLHVAKQRQIGLVLVFIGSFIGLFYQQFLFIAFFILIIGLILNLAG